MSSETNSTTTQPDTTTDTSSDPPPVEPPPAAEPEPVEESTPPPPPEQPTNPITFEPATYYSVDTVCLTQNRGDGTACPNLNVTATDPMVYSNAGKPIIVCGLCGKNRTILSATKLDPQPEVA